MVLEYGFSIEDSYGNSYSKISIDYPTEQQSDSTTTPSNSANDEQKKTLDSLVEVWEKENKNN